MQRLPITRLISFLCVLALLLSFSLYISGEEATTSSAITPGATLLYEGGIDTTLTEYKDADARLAAMTLVCESEALLLYADYATAQFAVKNRQDNRVWFSSPYDVAAEDMGQLSVQQMASLLRIEYYDSNLQKREMNAYAHAVTAGQVVAEKIDNGVAFILTLGSRSDAELLPSVAPADSFEENVLNKVSEFQKNKLLQYYRRYDLAELDESLAASYLEQYPGLQNGPLYVLRAISKRDKERLTEYLVEVGYTHEQMLADMLAGGATAEEMRSAYFVIRVEVFLDSGELVVNVPMDVIEAEDGFFLQKIHLLEYFGAPKQTENGYFFYPDGSGSLIDFSKGAQLNGMTLTDKVYGADSALAFDDTKTYRKSLAAPVFGIKTDDSACFVVLEEGAAVAELSLNSGVASSSYANVWASFNYASGELMSHTVNLITYTYTQLDKNRLTGNVRERFFFLDGERADYSGMANTYRTYLQDNGQLLKARDASSEEMPLYIGALGAVKTQQKWGIIPVTETTVLTSFEGVHRIAQDILNEGIHNLNIRLTGWANGGLQHTIFSKVKAQRQLGGQKGLEQLENFATQNGIVLFPDVDFSYVQKDVWFDGFLYMRDNAKTLTGAYAMRWLVDMATNQQKQSQLVVRPQAMLRYFENFNKNYKNATSGLALGVLGEDLHSDFSKNNPSNRVQSQQITEQILEKAGEQYELMTDGGNAYSYAYAQHILNLPSSSSSFYAEERAVPFLQMVLHGAVSYTGEAINLSGDVQSAVLRAVENGEALYFILTEENTDELLNTEYCQYYSTNYTIWKEAIFAQYKSVASVLDQVQGAYITNHTDKGNGVVAVSYSNGKTVWVNYGETPYTVDGSVVPAEGFICVS